MYLISRQTHPPTGIEHNLYCRFYNLADKNLVIGCNNILTVYRLIELPSNDKETSSTQSTSGGEGQNDGHTLPTQDSKAKLECLQSFHLHGTIQSMQAVSLNGSARDSILLSFPDAKLSVVEYDPTTHDLKTLSLHYFEEEDMRQSRTQFPEEPILRVDPESRCAAFLAYGQNIIILPFRKDIATVIEDSSQELSTKTTGPSQTSAGMTTSSGRSPVMASYKLNLSEEQFAGEKINNIIDMQFLEGYYEPTLLILHEPVRTWPGRVAVRQDTVSMVALSLDIHQKIHPIIWSTSHLPFDIFRALAVPRPVGGVLLFAANSLTYLNQSVPPYSVSLNSFTEGSTAFPMTAQGGVKISMDCSNACFISNDKLILGLKEGELFVVTLFNDGMRSIRSFHFDKVASTVISSCVTLCEDGYIFLGSRLGNSLLLKYTEKTATKKSIANVETIAEVEAEAMDQEEVVEEVKSSDEIVKNGKDVMEVAPEVVAEEEDDGGEPSAKKIKTAEAGDDENVEETVAVLPEPLPEDDIADWMAGDVALMVDDHNLDDFEKDVNADKDQTAATTYAFQVCDSIVNIGPCGRICMGEPAFLSEEFAQSHEPQIELVTTSGYGKNGALSVIHRTVRPHIVTTFDMPDCVDMWTVYGPIENDSQDSDDSNFLNGAQTHAFLILSREDSTMILQTDKGIKELEQSGFSSQSRTIFAGNLGEDKYILQISPSGVRLLNGISQLQNIPLNLASPITSASVSDPYAVIMTESGLIKQLHFSEDKGARLTVSETKLLVKKSKVIALTVYKDTSGLFTTKVPDDFVDRNLGTNSAGDSQTSTSSDPKGEFSSAATTVLDDEDELLYGSSTVEIGSALAQAAADSVDELGNVKPVIKLHKITRTAATYWLLVVRENGVLEVYSIPDYKLVYYIKNFPMGPKVLVDSVQSTDASATSSQQNEPLSSLPPVREILVTGLGANQSRPVLFARLEDHILIYEAYAYFETRVDKHLKIRFRKLGETVVLRKFTDEEAEDDKMNGNEEIEQEKKEDVNPLTKWFRPFLDISGYSGVFMCGTYPTWFFMGTRGQLRKHEMSVDGAVTCFAPFHNVNCVKGFLYFNKREDLRIATLPTQVSYDAAWPVRKVPLKRTAHFVNYHVESKCYCVVTSSLETVNKLIRIGGDEKDYEVLERDSRYIWPTTEKFTLQLFSPVSWEFIKGTEIDLDEWEHVTCIKNVSLASEGTESGLKGYLALSTNYCYGEDVTNRGRIWILDIIEVVPEPGLPLTKNRIKVMYNKEQKGPVTALCQVKGFLLSAIGQKIYIWQLKESQLVGVAFIDTQIYIHSAVSIKNLVLVSDIYKSISLLRYQEETRTLALVSRDTRSFEVYGCDFVVDQSQLCFAVSDSDANLIIYSYSPELRESYGGTRLIRRADLHLGSIINSFFRIRAKPLVSTRKPVGPTKQLTMYATLDGGLGYVLPITEKIYRRLLMLQNIMTVSVAHTAGLNPKAYRLCKLQKRSLSNPSKNVLDGDLISRFLTLSLTEKMEMSRKIGTTPAQIIDDIHEIDRATAHF